MKSNEINLKNDEVEIDFEGNSKSQTSFEKILIPEENYWGKLVSIELNEMRKYNKPEEKENNLVFKFKIEDEANAEHNNKEISHIASPKILKAPPTVKGGKVYNNSKLFDILETCGLLEKAKSRKEELRTKDGLRIFLNTEMQPHKFRLQVKTVKKTIPEEAYSIVGKILKMA